MINTNEKLLDILTDSQYFLISKIVKYGKKSCPKNDVLCKATKWGLKKILKVKKELVKLGVLEILIRWKIVNGKKVRDSNQYTITTNLISKYRPNKQTGDISPSELSQSELVQSDIGQNGLDSIKVLRLIIIDNNKLLKEREKAHTQEISELQAKIKTLESELNLNTKKETEEKSSAKKEEIIPPPTAEQLNAKSKTVPHYKITLHDYPFKNWTDQLKTNFLTYCQMRHEKAETKGFTYGFTQTKENVSEVEAIIFQYTTDIAQAAVKMATKGGWVQFFPDRIKNDIERERVKNQENEQKQAANNNKSIYDIFDEQPINYGSQDGHEGDNGTVDVEFTEG